MKWDDLEKFEKRLEKWHNRVYKIVCIGVFILFSDVVGLGIISWSNHKPTVVSEGILEPWALMTYDFIAYVGGPFILAFMCYTIGFTQFSFPFRWRGSGGGRKMRPPFTRQ